MYMKMEVYEQEKQRNCSRLSGWKSRQGSFVIVSLLLIVVLNEINTVTSLYIPRNGFRGDESDYEDLEQGASAPYQNQEGDGSQSTDGYEDNEPDGPYEETPRDEEGQADLEKFFDDHLGASDRDGIDSENLPSNLMPFILEYPQMVSNSGPNNRPETKLDKPVVETDTSSPYTSSASNPTMSYLDQHHPPSVETSYIKLPNKKLIITRQITRGPVYKGGFDFSNVPLISQFNSEDFNHNSQPQQEGSEVVATENEDLDPVYITNMTNKPFKIAQPGGYYFDPEEDFRDASRDFEEPPPRRPSSSGGERRTGKEEDRRSLSDLSFTDPEDETLFNDASETDEVFFAHDPYQTDLEAELKSEQSPEQSESSDKTGRHHPDARAESQSTRDHPNEDDSEGGWVNDGVEDMEVPSQSYQDAVLEKAAKQEALNKAASENQTNPEEEGQSQEGEPTQDDPDNQRMPNADYLKDDLKVDDEKYK